ncbi:MAG: ATP-binding protein [Flavobacterium sp.]|nr:MAG: ATP-binding protein [Flavobacterium sp.]
MNPFVRRRVEMYQKWERQLRERIHCSFPIDLEPPFQTFDALTYHKPAADDGRTSSIFQLLSLSKHESQQTFSTPVPLPKQSTKKSVVTVGITAPVDLKVKPVDGIEFLQVLGHSSETIAFEIIGRPATIEVQFTASAQSAEILKTQLHAFYPSCILSIKDSSNLLPLESHIRTVTDFAQRFDIYRPIRMPESFDLDPMVSLYSILEHLQEDETVVFQVLFQGTQHSWAKTLLKAITNEVGDIIFQDGTDIIKTVREKVSTSFFAVAVRLAICTSSAKRSRQLHEQISAIINSMSTTSHNHLFVKDDPAYLLDERIDDVNSRSTHKVGMLLNTKELLTFCHLPSSGIISEKLNRKLFKTKAAPAHLGNQGLALGINEHLGLKTTVCVNDHIRNQHMFLQGASGVGKSSLMCHMAAQDMEMGRGLILLDPHGTLADDILSLVPEKRMKDVVVFDPSDSDYAIGFNVLMATSEAEKQVLASDLVATFKRLSTSFGDQMYGVLANSVQTFLESKNGGTLIDLRRFLVDKQFREKFLQSVDDPSLTYYWRIEYPLMKTISTGPILTRLDHFLRPRLIRNMVAQKAGLSFSDVLATNKIVLVKLPVGLVGNENATMLGTFIVTKVLQAAMARQGSADRNNCTFYIDEVQNFATPSLVSLLQSVRKYYLSLTLATQSLQSLERIDASLADAIIANAATKIYFRLGDNDAKKASTGFSHFNSPEDFLNLKRGEAIARIEQATQDFNLRTFAPPKALLNTDQIQLILDFSRKKYGIPRQTIEEQLRKDLEITMPSITKKQEKKPSKEISPSPTEQELAKPISFQPNETPIQSESLHASETTDAALLKRKEESQHRYLQNRIKRLAQEKGYKAIIEAPTPDGQGRVDVSLENEIEKIAIEISSTTNIEWELHNIQKCLQAGYNLVISTPSNPKLISSFEQRFREHFSEIDLKKIKVLSTEAVFDFLATKDYPPPLKSKKIKGYTVQVEFDAPPEGKAKEIQETLAKTILNSRKK